MTYRDQRLPTSRLPNGRETAWRRDHRLWFEPTALDRVLDAVIEDHDAQRGWIEKLRDLLFAN